LLLEMVLLLKEDLKQ